MKVTVEELSTAFFFFLMKIIRIGVKKLGVKLLQKALAFKLHQYLVIWCFFKIISAKTNTQIFHFLQYTF